MPQAQTSPHDYYFRKIEIQSERFDTGVADSLTAWDVTFMTLQLDIFEHIDKPYLTGQLLFMDQHNLISEMNLIGTEKVTVTISTTVDASEFEIKKVFRIGEITLSKKSNDETELHLIHLSKRNIYNDYNIIANEIREQTEYKGKIFIIENCLLIC